MHPGAQQLSKESTHRAAPQAGISSSSTYSEVWEFPGCAATLLPPSHLHWLLHCQSPSTGSALMPPHPQARQDFSTTELSSRTN
ncbi:hypothetical protein P7K49_035550 [Saguinus oedipus]|uniref:Uncharacterized protein n=1 Tax=Saguinus oedipus TaxID=9490 RepID=A0ABQ9TNL1_SAGOE|nr:hypothetical protein P7K49_035550 [Saguinus oedipus]